MANKQIVMIMTDTQRKDMLSCYNKNLDMNTPYLDSLAVGGYRFERAYTVQPVCGPARSAIFTGTCPHTNGSVANSMSLNQKTKTLGQRLRDESIHAGYIGKYHLDGGDYFGQGICPDGWDPEYWFDMRNYLDLMSDEDRFKSRQFETVFNEEVLPAFTFANQCSDKAIDFIEKHKEEDYFLVVSYDEPHHPFLAPSQYFDMFKDRPHTSYGNVGVDLSNHPEHIQIWGKHQGKTDPSSMGLMGCNAFVDKEIGRVVEAIRKHTDEGCIIYTSDHGAGLGSHGIADKGPAMYEEITNVPFMINWPGHTEEKVFEKEPISHLSIVPTVLDFFGLKIPKLLEGKSLMPLFEQADKQVCDYAFMEFTRYEVDHDGFGGYQPIRAVTDGRFKLSVNLMTTDELYDTVSDPGEMINLLNVSEYKAIRNDLHDAVLNWMNETRDPYRGYYWERRPWREDAREATWAYTGMTRQRLTESCEVKQLDYATGRVITEFVRKKD